VDDSDGPDRSGSRRLLRGEHVLLEGPRRDRVRVLRVRHPELLFGIILLLIFGVWLEVIPIVYNTDVSVFSVQNAVQLSVPVFVLVTGSIGAVMRVSRNESAEFQNAEFMKTAKAKGVSPLRAYAYHVMRPTLVPLSTTLVGQLLALFLGSSLLVEVVFGIPGSAE